MKNNTTFVNKFLILFLIIQPLLDFYLLYSKDAIQIFGFSIPTIVRLVFVFVALVFTFFKTKNSKKMFWVYGFLLLLCCYLVFHFWNSLRFNQNIGENFRFSYVTELLYFARMFIPLAIIFIVSNLNINREKLRKTFLIISLIFSLEIIVTNVLGISLTSYGGNNRISGTFFSWFVSTDFSFEAVASKGFFYMANQVSAVFMLLLPINVFYMIDLKEKKYRFSVILMSIAMMMLGTRTASYGWILVYTIIPILYIFIKLFNKEKLVINMRNIVYYFLTFAILIIVFINSPLIKKRDSYKLYSIIEEQGLNEEIKKELVNIDDSDDEETINFIEQYSSKYSIPDVYIKRLYPYKNDTKFWINLIKLPYYKRGGNRNIQTLITKRVYNLNNNKFDKFFGMGYSRFRNAKVYIERDFGVHFFTIGIVGIILFLLPYLIISILYLIKSLKNRIINSYYTVLCFTVLIVVFSSYFTGHSLDELLITIYLGTICGLIFKEFFKKNNKIDFINCNYNQNKSSISVIVPVYNADKYLDTCLDSIVNQTIKNIEIIIVNDGSTDNSQLIIDKYTHKYNNVKCISTKNFGVSHARNVGIKKANGEYIAFVDSDDYIDKDMYEKMYIKAKSNDFDVVVSNVNLVYPHRTKKILSGLEKDIINDEQRKKEFMIYSYAVVWNKIYRKSLVDKIKFNEKSRYCEDVQYLYEVIPLINSIGVVDKYCYNYVQRENSLISTYDKKVYQVIDNFNLLKKIYDKNSVYRNYYLELEYSYVRYMFATFVKRLSRTKNKKEYYDGITKVINEVNKNYPDYRKNKYIKKLNFKAMYLKYFNKIISKIVYFIYLIKNNKTLKKIIAILLCVLFSIIGITTLYFNYLCEQKVPVLTYHNIVSDKEYKKNNDFFTTSESVFKKQLNFLKKNGYRTLSLDEYYCWKMGKCKIPRRSVLITFDDGYYSVYKYALPILKRNNQKAVSFVLYGNVAFQNENSKNNLYLSLDDIKKSKRRYVDLEYASHSMNLHDSSKHKFRTAKEIDYDIKTVKQYNKTRYYAYPNGFNTKKYRELLKENGFRLAFCFGPYKNSSKNDDNYCVSRIAAGNALPYWKFAIKMYFIY